MFAPISLLVLNPVAVVVRQDAPWKTIQELIQDLKQNPGKYKASGTAKWGSYDFARLGFLWKLNLKDEALPWVPTQGAAAAMQELLSGESMWPSFPSAKVAVWSNPARPAS